MDTVIDPFAVAATVLVIDDDPGIRNVLKRSLTLAGHQCVSASGAGEGVEYARLSHPDAIILDIDLPDGDGRDVLGALRRDPLTANVPILIISGNVDQFRRMQVLEAGAEDVLEKPFDPVLLGRRISWMVSKRRAARDN